MDVDRRTALKSGAVAALAGGPFAGFAAMSAEAATRGRGKGPCFPRDVKLVPVRDRRDGRVRLHLPEGFSYRSFHDTDTGEGDAVVLDDGTVLPGRHDGMGAFDGRGNTVVLVRNHEVNGPVGAFGPQDKAYDEAAGGGTTTIRTTDRGRVLSSYTSLNGTMMNCSGGVMPWGSWLSCEETVNGPDVGPDFTGASNTGLKKPHGYVFEVPADGESNRRPITRAGRFAHESVAFDPVGGALYLSEDNFGFPSGFYRYTPKKDPMKIGRLDNKGRLEMLAIKNKPNRHLEAHQQRGRTYKVEWVPIERPNPKFKYTPGEEAETTNDEALTFVGDQGRAHGAALFSRLEGTVYEDGIIYFTSTQGGGPAEPAEGLDGFGNGYGQVWGYNPRNETLTCVYQSPGPEMLDFPDNITTSPRGTLVLCEDSTGDNYLRGLSTNGKLWNIALNRLRGNVDVDEDRSGDEFAGSTFSPDGETLFVNIQASRGVSFAIWGPWRKIGV